jgi:tripartite-type tricarboxylate transporter receptor subunit TctC
LSTTAEQGFPTVRIGHWAGLMAPRGTPDAIIARMNAALSAVNSPEVQAKLGESGIETAAGSVADFAAFISSERQRLGALAAKAGMSGDQ